MYLETLKHNYQQLCSQCINIQDTLMKLSNLLLLLQSQNLETFFALLQRKQKHTHKQLTTGFLALT